MRDYSDLQPVPSVHSGPLPLPPRQPSAALTGASVVTFYYVLPFLGAVVTASIWHDLIRTSLFASLLGGIAFGVLSFRIRPKTQIQTWGELFRRVVRVLMFAGIPLGVSPAVYWPLKLQDKFPAFLPSLLISVIAAWLVYQYTRPPAIQKPRSIRGQSEGEGVAEMMAKMGHEMFGYRS